MKNIEKKVGRVVIVDDEPKMMEATAEILRGEGYEVTVIGSAEDAIKVRDEFDVAIIDGLNGRCFNVYKEIKARRKVIYSGSLDICERAKELGWEAWIKPAYILDIINKEEISA